MTTELKILNLAFRPLSDEDEKEEIDLGDDDAVDDGATVPDEDGEDDEDVVGDEDPSQPEIVE
jgi:hypothetical protein